jgi:hypothetical protein
VALRIALPDVSSARLFGFLALLDELLISMFLASVRAQTLPIQIETITAVSAFLIGVTTLTLSIEAVLRPRQGQRLGRACGKISPLRNQEMARCVADPRAAGFAGDRGSPSDMLSPVSLLSRIMDRNPLYSAPAPARRRHTPWASYEQTSVG